VTVHRKEKTRTGGVQGGRGVLWEFLPFLLLPAIVPLVDLPLSGPSSSVVFGEGLRPRGTDHPKPTEGWVEKVVSVLFLLVILPLVRPSPSPWLWNAAGAAVDCLGQGAV